MATVAKISVALPPEMLSLVRDVVDAGEYASSSEVVRDALREWQMKRAMRQYALEEVRRLWNEGVASGAGRAVAFADIKRKARARLQRKK
jgi:putative addiction module CopG family antidote